MKRKGIASILAILFLAIFATMAVVYAEGAGTNLTCADNQSNILQARLSAESGVAYLSSVMETLQFTGTPSGQALLDAAAAALQAQLSGSAEYMPDKVTAMLSRIYCEGSFLSLTP